VLAVLLALGALGLARWYKAWQAEAERRLVARLEASLPLPLSTDNGWSAGARPVAHAFGAIGGEALTNSREAFLANYARGFRVFEVDLTLTRDGALVASHDWDTPERFGRRGALTLAEFRRLPIAGRFSGLTAADVVRLVSTHPDVHLILDLKGDFPDLLRRFVADARRVDSSALARVVPQLYRERDLAAAVAVYPFRSYAYTLYRNSASVEEVVRFVRRTGVRVVVASESRFSPALARSLAAAGAVVYVHTINNPTQAAAYLRAGAHGVYTDTLLRVPQ